MKEIEIKEEAQHLVLEMVKAFPGIVDGVTEVNGADLVNFISETLSDLSVCGELVEYINS